MVQARVTQKGQVTIPKQIREYLHLNAGSKIDFVIDSNGDVRVIPLNVTAETLSGILHREGMESASLPQMEQSIAEAASDWTRH
ncbi:AbrB/MazE/SpoVT family DNA-binding domain-containing protein [Myxosarcina sp. GI1]|uniref:AbrB/MazE/SpoVT family DNA-binding domain-containing protein n=1 Tax=Myxosarcina sp. GI1 TaxID=1541065 RepID=UPI0005607654|nr:AbrB/MazE/SpoVT family DNA-binding domain-containing protein [Myxosarcina sp. GI1]